MARPSSNLTERLTVRLTPDDLARIKMDAEAADVEVMTLARARLIEGPIPRKARRKRLDQIILADVLQAVLKLGNNVNQIAKVANATGDLNHCRDARELQRLLAEIRDDVRSAMTA